MFGLESIRESLFDGLVHTKSPFLERPGNLTGPISFFEMKVSRRVGCVLTSNEV